MYTGTETVNGGIGAIENTRAIYQLALTKMPGIGAVQTKKLIRVFGDAESVFRAPITKLIAAGLPAATADAIAGFDAYREMDVELKMLQKKGIRTIFFTDRDYPRRLSNFPDAAPMLYYRGRADLNENRIVAIVGTREPDDYGRRVTGQIVKQLAQYGVVVISGLAYGIDAAAHEAAVRSGIPTIGVLGHGLDRIYPDQNKALAETMTETGGLLTCFEYGVKPDYFNFPVRNRLVAGLSDVLLVIQTGRKGGSIITAERARQYGKPIFAMPGRPTDRLSDGCNWLIQQGFAQMLISGEQLAARMGWEWPDGGAGMQGSLSFGSGVGASGDAWRGDGKRAKEDGRDEERLLKLILERDRAHIDELVICSGLDASTVALVLLNLELSGSIVALPGKRYMANI